MTRLKRSAGTEAASTKALAADLLCRCINGIFISGNNLTINNELELFFP